MIFSDAQVHIELYIQFSGTLPGKLEMFIFIQLSLSWMCNQFPKLTEKWRQGQQKEFSVMKELIWYFLFKYLNYSTASLQQCYSNIEYLRIYNMARYLNTRNVVLVVLIGTLAWSASVLFAQPQSSLIMIRERNATIATSMRTQSFWHFL